MEIECNGLEFHFNNLIFIAYLGVLNLNLEDWEDSPKAIFEEKII